MAGSEQTLAGAARPEDEMFAELLEAAKRDVARAHGPDERHAYRLVGSSISELHADAKLMARELGVAGRPSGGATTAGATRATT